MCQQEQARGEKLVTEDSNPVGSGRFRVPSQDSSWVLGPTWSSSFPLRQGPHLGSSSQSKDLTALTGQTAPVLATCDIHSKNRDKCQEHHEGTTLSYWLQESSTEKRAFELFRTLLLRCFFSEESEVMKRLSLRSGKRSFKERHRRSTCRRHLRNTGNGTDGLRLPR